MITYSFAPRLFWSLVSSLLPMSWVTCWRPVPTCLPHTQAAAGKRWSPCQGRSSCRATLDTFWSGKQNKNRGLYFSANFNEWLFITRYSGDHRIVRSDTTLGRDIGLQHIQKSASSVKNCGLQPLKRSFFETQFEGPLLPCKTEHVPYLCRFSSDQD